MSKGSIVNFKVRIKPSQKLIEFITGLVDVQLMPQNVINIYEGYSSKLGKSKKDVFVETIKNKKFTERQLEILKSIELKEEDFTNLENILNLNTVEDESESVRKDSNSKKDKPKNNNKIAKSKINQKFFLEVNDLRWVDKILTEQRKDGKCNVYLHELLQGSELILPENEIIPRNPELEARCRKLKEEQEAREYRNMTKNVDSGRKNRPDDTVGYQIKAINRQLIAVLQFIFSVVAGFAFGFLGVELIIGNLDFGFRLLLGIMCALIIALAEIYFLAKKLNEYDDTEEESFPPSGKKAHLD